MAKSKYLGSFTVQGATFSWEGPGDSVGCKGLDCTVGHVDGGVRPTYQTLRGAKAAARAYYEALPEIDKAWARGDHAAISKLRRAYEREQSLAATQRAERQR